MKEVVSKVKIGCCDNEAGQRECVKQVTAGRAMAKGRRLIYATQFSILVVYSRMSNAVSKADPVCA